MPKPVRIVLFVLLALMAVAGAALVGIGRARAHDGYEPECCNERHCRPISAPARQGAYWVLPDGRRFIAGSTRNSSVISKTGFHLCEWLEGERPGTNYEQTKIVQPKNRPVCLYAPDAEH